MIQRNLVYHTSSGGFVHHFGQNNHINDNIFAYPTHGELGLGKVEPTESFDFERNIMIWRGNANAFEQNWADAKIRVDNNIYWSADGEVKFPRGMSFQDWQKRTGHDANSLTADPNFVDPESGNFDLAKSSPAWNIGFVPFIHSVAGVKRDRYFSGQTEVPKTFEQSRDLPLCFFGSGPQSVPLIITGVLRQELLQEASESVPIRDTDIKRYRLIEKQIIGVLEEHEAGMKTVDL